MTKKTKFIASLFGVTAFATALMANGLAKDHKQNFSPAKAEEATVLYSEDFSQSTMPEGWNETFTLQDGKAVFNAANTWTNVPIPSTAFVESNNYEISFDVHYSVSDDLYFHLVGLDTTTPGNIYLAVIAGGTYWRLANYADCDIYDNSGDDQGCSAISPQLKTKFNEQSINLKFVVLDDVIEVYADSSRLIAVPLSAFGNNRYSSRRALVKGALSGFGIDCRGAAGSLEIDNFVMKEAKYGDSYFSHADQVTDGTYVLPLTYQNLYHSSFTMKADFEVHRSLVEDSSIHAYPKFGLIMNQIIPQASLSEPTNSINVQNYLDREFASPWLGGISPTTGSWSGVGGSAVQANYDDVRYTQVIDVLGDDIILTIKSNKEGEQQKSTIITSFTALGLTKGKLLSATINNAYTNVSNIEFFGYEGRFALKASSSTDRYFSGQKVSAEAKIYGEASSATDLVWYLDDVKTSVSDLVYENSSLATGKHTLYYGNETVKSEVVEFEIFENLLSISCDSKEIYPIDTATFTATVEGSVSADDVQWKVNDELVKDVKGATLTLSNLEAGEYQVKGFIGSLESNVVKLVVKQPTLSISTSKGSYEVTEKATFTAEALGIASTDVIKWFANDVELADKTGTTLEVELSDYAQAGQVSIQAKCNAAASNIVTIYIAKDVYAEISSDANWKEVYKQTIEAGSTFGAYAAKEDAAGNYYVPQNASSGNDASFPAIAIETSSWSMEYDLLITEDVKKYDGEYFVYPQAIGMDSKNPTDCIELAAGVGPSGLRTYVKTHAAGVMYEYADYSTGKDLSFDGDIVKIGWNHIVYAMQGNTAAFYVNGELVFYATIPNSSVPSGFIMSMYPGNGGSIPLGFKNFTVKGIVTPPPAVASVNVNASKVAAKVDESIIFSATVNPYNATYETVEWFVNGKKVEGANTLTFTTSFSEAGEYSVVCKIDGVESSAKKVTITKDVEPEPEPSKKKGCGGSIVASSTIISILSLAGIGLVMIKKRKEK